jgi:hypothetical protein
MYIHTKSYADISKAWFTGLKEPWLAGLILGIQGNFKETPDPAFSGLKSAWRWQINNLFDLFFKPIVVLILLAFGLCAFVLKLGIMLALLPLWQLIAVLISIKTGLPDYPQTWLSPWD